MMRTTLAATLSFVALSAPAVAAPTGSLNGARPMSAVEQAAYRHVGGITDTDTAGTSIETTTAPTTATVPIMVSARASAFTSAAAVAGTVVITATGRS